MPDRAIISQLEDIHADAFGWALHCCHGERNLAEDVLQNAYLKVLRQKALHDGSSLIKTWWFGVIRHAVAEEFRRRRVRESMALKLLRRWLPGFGEDQDHHPHAARRLELNEEAERLRVMLSTLPARQSEVLHLVFYQDLSLSEAAQVMGISLGSVRQHYERGKQRLRTLIEESTCHE